MKLPCVVFLNVNMFHVCDEYHFGKNAPKTLISALKRICQCKHDFFFFSVDMRAGCSTRSNWKKADCPEDENAS